MQFEDFFTYIGDTHLKTHTPFIAHALHHTLDEFQQHGDWPQWLHCLNNLPQITASHIDLQRDTPSIGLVSDCTESALMQLKNQLMQLHPWRKGPFNLFGMMIDCEWRSDWKWQRLESHISDLKDRYVLDVGCGNGYYSLRMQAAGARCVIGIDPSAKFFIQYLALKKYLGAHTHNLHFLPLRLEQLPQNMQAFDSIFSMGILYHRRSPFEHLDQLKQALNPGGELILETLVIDGDQRAVLVPRQRYACMRNVWFLPSCSALEEWLQRAGWENIRTVNLNTTCIEEQRSTPWMRFRSLQDFLDPQYPHLTIEGYPAPKRAIVIANKPGNL